MLLTIYFPLFTKAQSTHYIATSGPLYNEIARMDSILFDAFNRKDINKMKSLFAENLEIYQDNTGLRNYEQAVTAFKGVFGLPYQLTRKLVKGSLEVYPIKDYGAIETGSHTFCHIENGKLDCGTFKFMQIWQKKDGEWKLTRIITYDH